MSLQTYIFILVHIHIAQQDSLMHVYNHACLRWSKPTYVMQSQRRQLATCSSATHATSNSTSLRAMMPFHFLAMSAP